MAVTREDLRDVQVSLTAELARAYFELRGAQEQLSVAQRNAENQRRTLLVTRQRLDAGRGTAFDTERAQAQLSFTLASIPGCWNRGCARRSTRSGCWWAGRRPRWPRSWMQVVPLPAFPASVAIASPDSVVRRRPDVAAAERQVAVERALVGAAKADYLPRMTLGGSAGYTASSFDALGDRGTFRYAVGPIISWPALNLGRVKARVDVSRAREAEAQAQYNQTVLRALQDVETVAGPLPDLPRSGGADPGCGFRQRAGGGAGPAPVLRRGGRLPSGAGRGAHPAGGPGSVGPEQDGGGDGIRGAVQGAGRHLAKRHPVRGREDGILGPRVRPFFTRTAGLPAWQRCLLFGRSIIFPRA